MTSLKWKKKDRQFVDLKITIKLFFKFFFSSYELLSSDKDLLSKGLRFAIPHKQIDYSNFMTEFELLYSSTVKLLYLRFIYDI